MRPVIGITCDTVERPAAPRIRQMLARTYTDAVWLAGGNPVMLPHIPDAIDDQLRLCDGIILTGGDDPDMTSFGQPNHPAATIMDPLRQRYELALIAALDHTRHPVLGICLGMQLMCLHHGGPLTQHLDDKALQSHRDTDHTVTRIIAGPHVLPDSAMVHSHHHQAVASPGKLRICATGPGDVIEAVDQPPALSSAPRFYLGVQWHPERTAAPSMGQHLFDALIAAAKEKNPKKTNHRGTEAQR
ncbi:MAG: gamma-glutamyl-gamma-aminobutyrate hydrolase family protein [Phycisphaerales bacterium]